MMVLLRFALLAVLGGIVAGGIVAAQAPAGAATTTHPEVEAHAARVDALFEPWNRPGSPGAAVAVVRDGEVVLSRGYGTANLEYDVPITPASIFHVASISKQFTAFAVALLAQDGALSLDDDVRQHLPEVPDFGETISVRHLVHHTSGIRDQWELLAMAGWRLDDVITRDHIMKMMRHQRELNFRPGAEYLYSNMGYTLLAEIVERASGLRLAEFAEQRIFRPLGMDDTHFHDDHRRVVPNRAYSYAPRPGGGWQHAPLNYANVGATSLFTTVADLAKWDRNFQDGTVGGPALIRQMHNRGVLNSGEEIAYAFALMHGRHRGLETVSHGGADAGYRAHYVRFPDQRLAVAVFGNVADFNAARLALQVAEIFLGADMAPDEPRVAQVAAAQREVRVEPRALERLAGRYANPATDQVRNIEMRNGRLTLVAGQEFALVPVGRTRFRLDGMPLHVELHFETDRGGAATELREVVAGGPPIRYEPAPALPGAALAEYAGTYASEELGTTYRLVVRDGRLVAEHRRHDDTALTPTLPDRFSGEHWWFRQLRFERDERGQVTGFRLSGGRVRNLQFQRVGE